MFVKLMILAFVSIVLWIIVTEVQQYQRNDTNIAINNDECIVSVNGELIYKKEIDSVYDEFYDSGIEYKDIVENTIDEIFVIQQAKEYGIVCDGQVIEHAFNDLKRENNLPDVVFHSLRHSSTTYKLELTHGDIKSIQGDTGHATAAMVTEVYSHILDSKRKQNALAFDEAFYKQPDLRGCVEDARMVYNESAVSAMDVIKAVKESPELLNELRSLLLNDDETQGNG